MCEHFEILQDSQAWRMLCKQQRPAHKLQPAAACSSGCDSVPSGVQPSLLSSSRGGRRLLYSSTAVSAPITLQTVER